MSSFSRVPLVCVLSSLWATASLVGRLCAALLALYSCIAFPSAQATTISFEVTNVAGNTWAYAYVVQNDTLVSDIEEFTIFFDPVLYQNLTAPGAPGGWDPLVIQPDLAIPDAGFYDALALMGGIAPGTTLGGFSVQVDFLGVGVPGAQPFAVVDPINFAVLASGITQSAVTVPEPSSLVLLTAGLFALMGLRLRRLRSQGTPCGRASHTAQPLCGGMNERMMRRLLGLVTVALASTAPVLVSPAAAELVVESHSLVASQRVGRTEFDYIFRVTIKNSGPARRNVRATVTSGVSSTLVMEGALMFGSVSANATVTSEDTFTVRHDRRFSFNPSDLSFHFTFEPILEVNLENANAVQTAIGAPGGAIVAVASNGTRFTLTIPEGALPSPEPTTITVTPAAIVEGLPASGGFIAGVQFAPEGLVFRTPAILKIDLSADVPSTELAAYRYAGSGDRFSFHPIFLADIDHTSASAILRIPHFSGYGVARGSPQDVADHATQSLGSESASSAVAALLMEAGTAKELTDEMKLQLALQLQTWFDTLIRPTLTNTGNFAELAAAHAQFKGWQSVVQGLGPEFEADFAAEVAEAETIIRNQIMRHFEALNKRCLESNLPLCSRGPFLTEFNSGVVLAQQLGEASPDEETFCNGLVNKLPEHVTVLPQEQLVGFGDRVVVDAEMLGAGGRTLNLSGDELKQVLLWEMSPADAVSIALDGDPLSGKVIKDGPITLTAHACALTATALILTQVDISGSWFGDGSETVSGCKHPDNNGTFSGGGTVQVNQSGHAILGSSVAQISGSVGGTTFTGTVTAGPSGTFSVSGSLQGVDDEDGTPFSGSFSGSGQVDGPSGSIGVQWRGADIGENETCTWTGSGSGRR